MIHRLSLVKIIIGIAALASIGFNFAMRFPENEIWILGILFETRHNQFKQTSCSIKYKVTVIIYGGAGLTGLPLMNELIVETTYPIGEATSTGFGMIAAQALAAVLVVLSSIPEQGYSPEQSVCPDGEGQDLFWYLIIINGILVLYYPFFVFFYSCDYKRQNAIQYKENDQV